MSQQIISGNYIFDDGASIDNTDIIRWRYLIVDPAGSGDMLEIASGQSTFNNTFSQGSILDGTYTIEFTTTDYGGELDISISSDVYGSTYGLLSGFSTKYSAISRVLTSNSSD